MKQTVSNRLGGDLTASAKFAESIELLMAANDSVFFWGNHKPIAHIIKGRKKHD